MGAGYGNHEDAAEAAAGRPAAGSASRDAKRKTGSESGSKGSAAAADAGGQDQRDMSTPGTGALPSGTPQGGDVDPGAG